MFAFVILSLHAIGNNKGLVPNHTMSIDLSRKYRRCWSSQSSQMVGKGCAFPPGNSEQCQVRWKAMIDLHNRPWYCIDACYHARCSVFVSSHFNSHKHYIVVFLCRLRRVPIFLFLQQVNTQGKPQRSILYTAIEKKVYLDFIWVNLCLYPPISETGGRRLIH